MVVVFVVLSAVLVLRAKVVRGADARVSGGRWRGQGLWSQGRIGRDGHGQARLDLKKGRFCGEAGVAATPNSSDRAQDYGGEANN